MSWLARLLGRGGPLSRAELAQRGEEAAARKLRADGYRIIARNFRCRSGELDIIAEEGGELVFVEVRSRTSTDYGTPAESVNRRKQRQIARTASHYLRWQVGGERACRYDVVEVYLTPTGRVERVVVLRGAFRAG